MAAARHGIAALALGLLGCGAQPEPAQAQQARQMLNGFRSEEGLGRVAPSERLEAAAMAHALDMMRGGFFGHRGSDGSDLDTRVRRTGYAPCALAENIALGQGTLAEVMGDWVASPGHRANLALPQVTDYGLVRAEGGIWVLVLGRDGC
jgi:uncharacterized protein YkwD